jgi:hypothetical protein
MSPIFTDGQKENLLNYQKSRGYRRRTSGHVAASLQAFVCFSSQLQVFLVAHDNRNQHGIDDSAQEEDTQGRAYRAFE